MSKPITTSDLLKKYNYLQQVKQYPGNRSVTKNIKTELKREFPGVKFSVVSSHPDGSVRINVRWADGPTHKAVEGIVDKYQEGYFNAMEDTYEYDESEFNRLFGGVGYVSTYRTVSDSHRDRVLNEICLRLGYPKMTWEAACKFNAGGELLSHKVNRELHSRYLTPAI